MISGRLREEVEALLGPVTSISAVSGGSISQAYRLEAAGGAAFLKALHDAPDGFFEAEAAGLQELAASGTSLIVPRVLSQGSAGDDAYILLEWLAEGTPADCHDSLGRGLAALHRERRPGWGWRRDGFIGSLAQANRPSTTWSEFWQERRLEPQLRLLRLPVGSPVEWMELMKRLPEILSVAEKDGPSLLHGDLWSGNALCTRRGAALIDPACYHGHREVDLAMAELFGGFGERFFSSYSEVLPLLPGYEARKGVYQLYYLLVHVNLFGASYVSRTHHTLRRVLTLA